MLIALEPPRGIYSSALKGVVPSLGRRRIPRLALLLLSAQVMQPNDGSSGGGMTPFIFAPRSLSFNTSLEALAGRDVGRGHFQLAS